MTQCSALNCKNKGVHAFPKDLKRRRAWENALGIKNFKAKDTFRLCSMHFRSDDYYGQSKYTTYEPQAKFLKKTAVPSMFSSNISKEAARTNTYFGHDNCDHTYAMNFSSIGVSVKQEPESDESVFIKEEGRDVAVGVKAEAVSEAAMLAGLYADHVVKDELVLGPEVPIRPHVTSPHVIVNVKGDGDATGSQAGSERDTEANPYACEICGQKFKEISFYLQHKQHERNMEIVEETVTKQTTFRCDTCDKVYTSKSGLYQHRQKHISARFSCKHCDKQFPRLCYLKKHEKTHTKPNSCDICDRSFAESSALMTHKRTHTGEKPYNCEICEKKIAHLSGLAKHKRIHTGEKPYTCIVCKKQFRCASHLVLHRKVHSSEKPHSCETCKKQFADVASLTVHRRIHTGEKPFTCEICKKQFTRNSSLFTHRLNHTHGGFSCKSCKKQFRQMANLRKHVAVQHPGETTP